jgi:radical SAM enzyme (rSAM/lipoprotein system)
MPLKDFLSVIDEITPHVTPNKTTIVLTGGEPLVRNDIETCGAELYQRGYPWGIVSNGFAWSEKRFGSLLDNGLRSITISLDGLENSHNWLRNNPHSYRKALDAIKLLPMAPDLKYDVVTCVQPHNFNELSAIKDLLINMGVKYWRLFTIFPVGRAATNADLQLGSAQWVHLMEFIKKTRLEKEINISYGCEGFLGPYETEVRDQFFFCKAGINIGSVLADGSISACPSLRSNFIQGNIYNDNFMDVWYHRFEKFRNRDWTKTGLCADCSYFTYCNGNGLHLREESTGELLFCHLHKILDVTI